MSYQYKQKQLLLKCYLIESRNLLNSMKSSYSYGDYQKAARTGLRLAAAVKQVLAVKKDLRRMEKQLAEIRRQAKYNLYPGGNLYTGQ